MKKWAGNVEILGNCCSVLINLCVAHPKHQVLLSLARSLALARARALSLSLSRSLARSPSSDLFHLLPLSQTAYSSNTLATYWQHIGNTSSLSYRTHTHRQREGDTCLQHTHVYTYTNSLSLSLSLSLTHTHTHTHRRTWERRGRWML